MKRKILVTLLAFCLIASLCVVGAAAAAGEPCEGGESCNHEAAIGDVHYASLNDTLQYDAKPGDTIVVLKNCEIDFYNPKNNSILDLNGHNVVYSGEESIRFSGKGRSFSIVDSSAEVGTQGGTFRATGERDMAEAVFQISGGATFNVNNINIESNGCSIYPLQNNTSVNIKDSKIESSGQYCLSTNAATEDNYGVIINISGSTLTTNANKYDNCAVMFNVRGSLNIENSSITGDRQAVLVRAGDATIVNSDITVTGEWLKSNGNTDSRDTGAWSSGNEVPSAALIVGNYYSGAADAYLANANVTVEDTVVTARGTAPAVYVDGNTTYNATLEMTGEETSVTGTVKTGKQTSTEAMDITVTGGTFTDTNVGTYFPENSALEIVDGKVVTNDETAVAKVNGVPYKTLQAAIDAAEGGDTVTLVADVTEGITAGAPLKVKKDITIEGRSKTISLTLNNSALDSGRDKILQVEGENAKLTLNNVTLNINGFVDNANEKRACGDAIDLYLGGDLEANNSIIDIDNVAAAFVIQTAGETIVLNNTTVNADNVRGNGSQGGEWTVNDSRIRFTNCGDNAFSVETATIDSSVVAVNGSGLCGIMGTDISIINGSTVTVTGSGKKLPQKSNYAPNGEAYNYAVELKKNGKLTVEDSILTLSGNVNDDGAAIDNIFVSEGTTTDTANGTVNAGFAVVEGSNQLVVRMMDGNVQYSNQTVTKGNSVYLPTLSKSGYTFTGWRVNNSNTIVRGGESYTITANTTFTAVWNMIMIPDTYDIAVDQPAHGTVDVSFSNASQGSVITVTATPDEGYELVYITVDGEPISGNSFVMPDHAVEVSALFAEIGKEVNFVDVSRADWFYDYVQYVAQNGLMEGTTRTAFEPNASMTRAMFWTVLARIDGETITGDAWKTLAQTWAVESGISDGTNADALITREQMVTMLYRYAGSPVAGGMAISEFTDSASVSGYATDAVTWALSEGILTGMGDGILAPQGTATRAQAAAMLMRFVEA